MVDTALAREQLKQKLLALLREQQAAGGADPAEAEIIVQHLGGVIEAMLADYDGDLTGITDDELLEIINDAVSRAMDALPE